MFDSIEFLSDCGLYVTMVTKDPLSGINPDRRGPLRNTMTAINITQIKFIDFILIFSIFIIKFIRNEIHH